MAKMTYENPDDFKQDEDKWLKFFSTKAFVSMLVVLIISFFLIYLPISCISSILAIIIMLILLLLTFIFTSVAIPVSWNLSCSGHTIGTLIFRILLRRMKRTIYIRNYEIIKKEKN